MGIYFHNMSEILTLLGVLTGHSGSVTAIDTPVDPCATLMVSASRDKTIIVWGLTGLTAQIRGVLKGHSHFVQDIMLSLDAHFCLSGSWDGTLRLWDINTGLTTKTFVGHTKDVLSVAFSSDNRQIVSGSRDKTIRLWNTLGECKFVIRGGDGHSEWVSCVRFSPAIDPTIVSSSWDKVLKSWSLPSCRLKCNFVGHTCYLNTVAVSPDGSLCASGGRDGFVMLWDLVEGKKLYQLNACSVIHSLCFSPNKYWLCAATETSIKIWDLERKNIIDDIEIMDFNDRTEKWVRHCCNCVKWSADGSTLFTGCTDGKIRMYSISES